MDSAMSSTYSTPLRQELTCAICLDLLFEPSTTSCGHTFCRKCLLSSLQNKNKETCPTCRKCIRLSEGEVFNVNIIIWNIIRLLFPKDVEAMKAASQETERDIERDNSTAQPNDNNNRLSLVHVLTQLDYHNRMVIREIDDLRLFIGSPPPPPPNSPL